MQNNIIMTISTGNISIDTSHISGMFPLAKDKDILKLDNKVIWYIYQILVIKGNHLRKTC